MKILIFGASGATGQHLVRQALDQQHEVTAFVRDTGKITLKQDNLRVLQGNVSDYEAVLHAIQGQDAVISALGAKTPFKYDQVLVDGFRNILLAMESTNVQRLIYLSTVGVKDSRKDADFFTIHIAPFLLKNELAGHEAREAMIRESHLQYTIVHLPKMTNGKQTGKYVSGEKIKSTVFINSVSRADTAEFMLKQLTDPTYIGKTVRVMASKV